MKALVMGPGHSGSKYLKAMLIEMGYEVTHEMTGKFRGPAGSSLEQCDWQGAAKWLKGADHRILCGFPYGFMVDYLRHHIPGLRVICVCRSKKAWMASGATSGVIESTTSYPAGIESYEQYWDIYTHLMFSITPPILQLNMADLNECQPRIEEFLS